MVKLNNCELIILKWVFRIKYLPVIIIKRFKARLLARDFNQPYGIDYKEIFAPMLMLESLKIMMAIIAMLGLETYQIDICNA